jgi:hypothetical protein
MTADDRFAARLRGFGPVGVVAILVIVFGNVLPVVPLSAVLVLAWVRRTGTPWREIGYARPVRFGRALLVGIPLGVAFKLLMKSLVMPVLGADPVNQAYHYLAHNRAALPGAVWTMIVFAGFGEETVFRGFLFERFGKLLGTGARARALTVLITSIGFGLAHYANQGLAGTEQAMITGLVFGTIFAVTGRIWMLMVAHAAFDLTALWMIYWDLESRVAHLIFR